VHRSKLPKRHVFRREFEQHEGQLAVVRADGVKTAILDILS
jgi:hypothetical protein